MATQTTNYNLSKPDANDPFGNFRQSYNDNMDIIDQNLGGGGGNADVVHLTKAEYDALPDTKLSDNKIYLIEDAPSGGGGSGHTILDPNGTVLTQRSYLQFTGGVTVTDDSANDKTVVNISGGGGSSTLAGLSDVDLNNLSDGQIIKYNSTTQKWENANSGGGGGGSIQITSTVLFEPTVATSTNVDYTLSDSIDNYDFISIINGVWSEYYGSGDKFAEDSFVPVDTFNRLYADSKQYAITSYSTRFLHLNLHGSTLRVTAKSNLDVCKIIGHKLSGGGGSSTEYSLTEKVIGKWIDNSTLYERVIEYSCQNNANIQVADAMSNGEQLKNVISPIFIASNGDMIADRWVGMDFWQWVYDHTSGIMVQRKTSDGNWQSGVTFRAIIQYTKATP